MRIHGTTALFLLMCVLIGGCGLFEPRVPDEPGGGGVSWIQPTEPESVFVNIANSLEGKVIANYMRCFPDTGFVFHPDPSDSVELADTQPGVYDNWTRSVEEAVAQVIFDEAASLKVTFELRDTTIYIGDDEAFFYHKYQLQVIFKVGGSEFFHGLVDFHMRREGNLWYIYTWTDKRDPEFPMYRSWGNFKGTKRVVE